MHPHLVFLKTKPPVCFVFQLCGAKCRNLNVFAVNTMSSCFLVSVLNVCPLYRQEARHGEPLHMRHAPRRLYEDVPFCLRIVLADSFCRKQVVRLQWRGPKTPRPALKIFRSLMAVVWCGAWPPAGLGQVCPAVEDLRTQKNRSGRALCQCNRNNQ